MKTLVASVALLGALSTPMVSHARSIMMPHITDAHAKRVALQAVKAQTGYKYKVTLDAKRDLSRKFTAEVNWGKGPHIMIALPTYRGTVDMAKYTSAKGVNRVKLFTRGTQPNH